MAFDNTNVSLVTKIEAGDGVIVSHAKDADGFDVWTAEVDQAWVVSNLQASFDAAAIARIEVIEEKLGIGATADSDVASDTTKTIAVTGDVTTLTVDLPITWKVLTTSGDAAVSRSVTVSQGTSIESALKLIGRSIASSGSTFVSSVTNSGASSDFVMVSSYEDYTIEVTATSTADNVVFTVTQ